MKFLALTAVAAGLLVAGVADAATTITGLFNTGVAANGLAATGDNPDLHWTLSGMGYGPDAFTSVTNGAFPTPYWMDDTQTSRWITPTQNAGDSLDMPQTGPNGYYTYTLTFTLPQFSAASFSGQFAADNDVIGIKLNNNALGAASPGNALGGFSYWTPFSASTGDFVAGVNTLDILVRNWAWGSGNATGFRAEFTSSSLAVPEPAAWSLMIVGFGGMGAMLRSQRRRRFAA